MTARPMRSIPLVILSIAVGSSFGCRTPWAPMANPEPSFGALIDAERSESRRAGQTIDAISTDDDLAYDDDRSTREQRRPSRQESRGDSTREADIDLAAATDELDPEHAALMRLQMEAVRRRAQEDTNRIEIASKEPKRDEEVVTFKFSDSEAADSQDDESFEQPTRVASKQTDRAAGNVTLAAMEQGREPDQSQVVAASHASRRTMDDVPLPTEVEDKLQVEFGSQMKDGQVWQDVVRDASERIKLAIEETSNPEQKIELEKSQRLLSLAIGDLQEATVPVPGLDANLQQYLQHSLTSWHDVTDPTGHPHTRKRSTLALRSQRKATQYLAAASDLSVANAAFCTAVDSFGDVKRFDSYKFQPGQEVLLYCEVDNFVSAPMPDGSNHETHLRGSYKITNTSGYPVDEQALPANQDVSQTPRRDYFMVYRIWLPQSIAAGNYQLNLAIEDINGRKFGNEVIDFEVVQ